MTRGVTLACFNGEHDLCSGLMDDQPDDGDELLTRQVMCACKCHSPVVGAGSLSALHGVGVKFTEQEKQSDRPEPAQEH